MFCKTEEPSILLDYTIDGLLCGKMGFPTRSSRFMFLHEVRKSTHIENASWVLKLSIHLHICYQTHFLKLNLDNFVKHVAYAQMAEIGGIVHPHVVGMYANCVAILKSIDPCFTQHIERYRNSRTHE